MRCHVCKLEVEPDEIPCELDHGTCGIKAVAEARSRGLARASKLGLFTGLDRSHTVQGSNFNPRGWGRR
jgi:hypothetical protein